MALPLRQRGRSIGAEVAAAAFGSEQTSVQHQQAGDQPMAQIQQQVAAKRAELEEQKRNLLQQQAQVRELEMDQIVEQGQLESTCELKVGDNLVQKMQVAIVVKDGVVQSIEEA